MRWSALAMLLVAATARAQDEAPPPAAPEPEAPAASVPAPPAWVSRDTGDLVLLDKIAAKATAVSLHAGSTVRFGTLSVTLRTCDARPSDRRADSTAWLDIADSTPGAPAFHGWMLAQEPSISALEHPSYDVRLVRCR